MTFWSDKTEACTPDGVQILPGVTFAGEHDLQAPCVIGRAPDGAGESGRPLVFGPDLVVDPFVTISGGSTFGAGLHVERGADVREHNLVGDDCSIGANSVLEPGNRIGSRVRIESGCCLRRVTIEDDVFVGPNVTFTDDPHPMGCPRREECRAGATVRRLARIGAGSTILPGVEIGEDSVVGAGSVVVHDVPPGAVVAGNPARVIKQVYELACKPGWLPHPYDWPPYAEPQLFEPGEACEEVVERVHVAERYRAPERD